MSQPLEIHIDGHGKVKVIEGLGRRVFHSTEEAVGLALLRLNPAVGATIDLTWQDFLADRGVAMALTGDQVLTLLVIPAASRTLQYGRGSTDESFPIIVPTLLVATSFRTQRMERSQVWCVKPGSDKMLTCGSADPVLAPFPYGNVFNHGGICWGTTNIRDIRTPVDMLQTFFASNFNGDLYNPGMFASRTTPGMESLLGLLRTQQPALPLLQDTAYGKSVAAVGQDLSRS
jgi:hypothetical protein